MSVLVLKLYNVRHINLKIQLSDASAHPSKSATHIEKQDTYAIEITMLPFPPPPHPQRQPLSQTLHRLLLFLNFPPMLGNNMCTCLASFVQHILKTRLCFLDKQLASPSVLAHVPSVSW